MKKKVGIIGTVAFGLSLLAGTAMTFAQTTTPSPTTTVAPTASPTPTGSVQGSSVVPSGAPATGRG